MCGSESFGFFTSPRWGEVADNLRATDFPSKVVGGYKGQPPL